MAYLELLEGDAKGKQIPLTADATVLGRNPSCDLAVSGSAVSGRHCRIEKTEQGYQVVDLDSTNGTFVNDKRVQTEGLHKGDLILLGSTPLRIDGDDLAAAPKPAETADAARTTASLARAQMRPRTLADAAPVRLPKDFGQRRDSRRNWKIVFFVVLVLIVITAAYFVWQFFLQGGKPPV